MAVLPDKLEQIARVLVAKNGTVVQGRQQINLIEGTYVTLTVTDTATSERVDVTFDVGTSAITELIQDVVGALTGFGGSGLTFSYDDGAGTVTLAVGAGHGIDVTADAVDVDETELDHALIGGTDPAIAKTLLTTRGDVIVRDASAPARLAVGAADTLLRSDGTDPSWGKVEADMMQRRGTIVTCTGHTVNNVTLTTITWATEVSDSDGYITVSSTTVTIPSGLGGLYAITLDGGFGITIATRGFFQVIAGGRTYTQSFTTEQAGIATVIAPLAAADTIVCKVFQQSGGNRTDFAARLQVHLIGA
jgi:hypothetical protein